MYVYRVVSQRQTGDFFPARFYSFVFITHTHLCLYKNSVVLLAYTSNWIHAISKSRTAMCHWIIDACVVYVNMNAKMFLLKEKKRPKKTFRSAHFGQFSEILLIYINVLVGGGSIYYRVLHIPSKKRNDIEIIINYCAFQFLKCDGAFFMNF